MPRQMDHSTGTRFSCSCCAAARQGRWCPWARNAP